MEIYLNGSKLWRFKYRMNGKEKRFSLVAWPEVTLANARKKRSEFRLAVLDGRDPSLEGKKRKRVARINASHSFASVAEDFLTVRMVNNGRAERTVNKARWCISHLLPTIGNRPIADIEPAEILEVLKKIERRGHRETAHRTRSVASRVFRHGVASALCKTDPAALLGDALSAPIVKHHAAILEPEKLGQLLRDIENYGGSPIVKIALKLLPHICTRPSEMRLGQWQEIDWAQSIWNVPAKRTKMRRIHAILLSTQSVRLLRELEVHSGGFDNMFPGLGSHLKTMSENSINQSLRRMGYGHDEVTGHGFRSTASTLLNESGKWHPDAIERSLAHGDSNAIRGIDNHGNFWDERVEMMQWWSDYLDQLRDGVTILRPEFGQSGS